MVKLKFYLLILLSNIIYGQNNSSNIIVGSEEETELTFQKYDSLIIKKDLKKLEDVKNDTPENLIKSILSATTQEWVDYNTMGASLKSSKRNADYFTKIKQMDRDKNYIQLVHKVVFQIGGVPTEIIKFYFKQENSKITSGCYVLQKIDNRWYKVSNSTTANLTILIMRLKTDVLLELFSGKISNPKLKEVYNKIYSGKVLDLRKFENTFFSWYGPIKNNEILNLTIDSKTW